MNRLFSQFPTNRQFPAPPRPAYANHQPDSGVWPFPESGKLPRTIRSAGMKLDYLVENLKTVVVLYSSPGFRIVEGKFG